jgi:hypothetical protein
MKVKWFIIGFNLIDLHTSDDALQPIYFLAESIFLVVVAFLLLSFILKQINL